MENPELYITSNSMQKKDVISVIESYRNHFKWEKEERILDIGCGPGDVTAAVLLPSLPEDSVVVCCDISEEMINYGNKTYKDRRLTFVQVDIQQKTIETSLELESFNKIFSFYCLHWIFDHRQTVKNIYSLLKPGGEILLMFLTPDNPVHQAFEKLKSLQKWNKYIKDINWFYESSDPPTYFSQMLQEVGFEEVHCYLKTENHHYPSWEYVLDFLQSVNPYLRHLPKDMISEFHNEAVEMLKKDNRVKNDKINNGIIAEYNVMVAFAKKGK